MGTEWGIRRIAREVLAPLVGMAFFWAFLRYQNYFRLLYPQSMNVSVGTVTLPAHAFAVGALVALIALAFARWRPVTRLLAERPWSVTLACALGSLGTVLALLQRDGALGPATLWASAPLVSLGFLAALLAWATYLSDGFDRRKLVIIVVSYLVSLLVFRHMGSTAAAQVAQNALTVAMPLVAGLGWRAALPARTEQGAAADAALNLRGLANPSLWLFAAFLLAGSIIRGIVDIAVPPSPLRHTLSLVIVSLFALACVAWMAFSVRRHGSQAGGARGHLDVARFAMACWIVFSSLFFCGVFILLVLNDGALGGNVVVIARSMLGITYWILLCDLASRYGLAPVPLFLICEALVEALSWVLSYVAVPLIAVSASPADIASPQTLATMAVCSLAAIIAVICGIVLGALGTRRDALRRDTALALEGGLLAGTSGAQALEGRAAGEPAERDDETTIGLLVDRHGLTPREALIAVHYAHGYSLRKVSEELDITNSSAQSCIRSVYRKLAIHTKDELIAAIDAL